MAVDFSRQSPIAGPIISVVMQLLPGLISLPTSKTMSKARALTLAVAILADGAEITTGGIPIVRQPKCSTLPGRRRGECPRWTTRLRRVRFQFFALDTQTVALSERQRKWLDDELSRSQARWKVVYGHHPVFSGGNYEDRPDLIAKLLPILKDRADVYICGHDHNLQAIRPEGNVRFYIAGGGGASLYQLRPYERSVFASSSNGFAVIDADATQLTVSLVDGTGKTLHVDTLKKPASIPN